MKLGNNMMKKRNKSSLPPRDIDKNKEKGSKITDFEASGFKYQKQTKSKPK